MAPSEKKIVDGIAKAVKALFADLELRETLTVRTARIKAEEDLGLDAGFLSIGAWKDRSKTSIRELVESLQEAENGPDPAIKPKVERIKSAPVLKKAGPVTKSAKRAATEPTAQSTKRQKKQHTPIEDETSELAEPSPEQSEASSFGDSDKSDKPNKKKEPKAKVRTSGRKRSKSKMKVMSDDDEGELEDDESQDISARNSDASDSPKKKSKAKPKGKALARRQSKSEAKVRDSDESEEEGSDASVPPRKRKASLNKKKTKNVPTKSARAIANSDTNSQDEIPEPEAVSTPQKKPKDSVTQPPSPDAQNTKLESKSETGVGSASDESIVLDPIPKPKRQRVPKGEKRAKESKAPKALKELKASSSKVAAATKELSSAEIQIKTLQTQLRKCGMKNIWQFELKKYGDDNNAKITHLQDVLKQIGMVGKFSEHRAKEIKEQRELLADVEEVTAMDGKWGLNSGRRSRGTAPKTNLKKTSEDNAETGDKGGNDRDDSKRKSVGQDGDESESDEQPAARRPRARAELAFLDDEEDSDE
ncbi:transcriptional regulator [Diplocarpon rosae]|nr:transcriptional regulator [Diplocarpon rosae]